MIPEAEICAGSTKSQSPLNTLGRLLGGSWHRRVVLDVSSVRMECTKGPLRWIDLPEGRLRLMMAGGSIKSQKSTALGRAFIQFISTPEIA